MNAAVVRQALRLSRKTLLVAGIGFGAFLFLSILGSSLFLEEITGGAGNAEFFAEPPRAVEALSGASDFLSPIGWLSSAMNHPISLTLQTLAALTVAASIPTEIERGTLDLILARPVSRAQYIVSKIAAAAGAVALVQVAGLVAMLVARSMLDDLEVVSFSAVFRLFAASFCLFLAFSMLSFLISARSSLRARALGLSVGLVVVSFFLNFLGLLFDEASFLRYLSPFHYFSPGDHLSGDAPWYYPVVLLALAAAAGAGAYRLFSTRDLTR
ncbi:MAG TPA: ABC transporter permease subunit [Actinomycetota bacterium]|nr:ABC transporter permease subunit [Actinomycetota bacterium]